MLLQIIASVAVAIVILLSWRGSPVLMGLIKLMRFFSGTSTTEDNGQEATDAGQEERLSVLVQTEPVECIVCCSTDEITLKSSLCDHTACKGCWLRFFCTQIESFKLAQITCVGCRDVISPDSVCRLLYSAISEQKEGLAKNPAKPQDHSSEEEDIKPQHCELVLRRYEDFLLRRALMSESNIRWCPSGCGYGFIANGFENCPKVTCQHPSCKGLEFCCNCQMPWYNAVSEKMSEDGVVKWVQSHKCNAVEPPSPSSPTAGFWDIWEESRGKISESMKQVIVKGKEIMTNQGIMTVKRCPHCLTLIHKIEDGSCNSMTCSVCGNEFCWLCLSKNVVGHFSSGRCPQWGSPDTRPSRRAVLLFVLMTSPLFILLLICLLMVINLLAVPTIGLALFAKSSLPADPTLRFVVATSICLAYWLCAPWIYSFGMAFYFPVLTTTWFVLSGAFYLCEKPGEVVRVDISMLEPASIYGREDLDKAVDERQGDHHQQQQQEQEQEMQGADGTDDRVQTSSQ
ncbi:unnamed protein product [Calicophoron daubneyi]|uniref:RBR-type E3 ubiquitin transferase n=1 Tax=Calicophoron daubneyi TaxID=300641 RepID=A0AAV2TME0_CALDB